MPVVPKTDKWALRPDSVTQVYAGRLFGRMPGWFPSIRLTQVRAVPENVLKGVGGSFFGTPHPSSYSEHVFVN